MFLGFLEPELGFLRVRLFSVSPLPLPLFSLSVSRAVRGGGFLPPPFLESCILGFDSFCGGVPSSPGGEWLLGFVLSIRFGFYVFSFPPVRGVGWGSGG